MKPIEFKQSNLTFAKNQPEYLPLPAHRDNAGTVTTCWGLTFRERMRVLLTGKFFLQQMTFNQPLQPIRPTADNPLEEEI
jgi:hypothetical protein